MPRVNHVKRSRKERRCCGCGTTIAVGDPYKWIKFRYGGRRDKCGKCGFRSSELTQSKLSNVYAAQEEVEDYLAGWDGDMDDLRSTIESAVEQIREVKDEYEEAAEAMGEAGQYGESRERADELESWLCDIEGTGDDLDDFEGDVDENDEPKDADEFEEWKQHVIDQVQGSDLFTCPI